MPSTLFHPPPEASLPLFDDLIDTTLSLRDIAHRHNTSVSALSLWLAHPDTVAQLSAMHAGMIARARVAAASQLEAPLAALVLLLKRYLIAEASGAFDHLPPDHQHRQAAATRRASLAILRFIQSRIPTLGPKRDRPAQPTAAPTHSPTALPEQPQPASPAAPSPIAADSNSTSVHPAPSAAPAPTTIELAQAALAALNSLQPIAPAIEAHERAQPPTAARTTQLPAPAPTPEQAHITATNHLLDLLEKHFPEQLATTHTNAPSSPNPQSEIPNPKSQIPNPKSATPHPTSNIPP